jgi:nucleoside triphosphate diphosphatase
MTKPPSPPFTLPDLVAVMAALRTPGTGCPWDLEQTFQTIAPYTIEEAYEVADAIQRGDLADLKDELGDLLLQVVYHARLAEEQSAFALPDVIEAVTAKMIRRHPHVFGDADARAAGAPEGFWEKIKAEEKVAKAAERARLAAASHAGSTPPLPAQSEPKAASVLDDVPVVLPALTRAIKLQEKAARVGFDWPSVGPVLDKVREEISELEAEMGPQDTPPDAPLDAMDAAQKARLTEEFGDLMFVMANLARHLQIDPEATLRAANEKFRRRFQGVEQLLAAQGKSPGQSNLAEMDALWDAVKRSEKA